MTASTLLGLLLGAGCALSIWLIVLGVMDPPPGEVRWWRRVPMPASRRRLVVATVAAGVVGAVTGWPVAGLLVLVAALTLPQLLGQDRPTAARTEKLEAIAVWAEMLRDTLSAAAGLEQAILATAAVAPPAVGEETARLAIRIDEGQPLADSLRAFAEDVDDPVADMVVVALLLAAERQARQLAPLLGQLAASTRAQVAVRLRIEASRARVRTSVRMITLTTLAMAGGLIVLNRSYLEPYSTALGQMVLAVVGGLFALAFWWLAKIATLQEEPRVLKAIRPKGEAVIQ